MAASEDITKQDLTMMDQDVEIAQNKEPTDIPSLCGQVVILVGSLVILIITFPFTIWFCFKIIHDYQRIIMFKWGRIRDREGPGLVFFNPFITTATIVDMRWQIHDINKKSVMTLSAIPVNLAAVVSYKIEDPRSAVLKVKNVNNGVKELVETILESVTRSYTLEEVIKKGEIVCKKIYEIVKQQTYDWGVTVERIEIVNVEIPEDLQKHLTEESKVNYRMNDNYMRMERWKNEKMFLEFVNEATDILERSPYAHSMLNALSTRDMMACNPAQMINFSLFPQDQPVQLQRAGMKS